jgi:hypothetical protein
MGKYNSKSLKKKTNTPARQKVNDRMFKLIKTRRQRQKEINSMFEPNPKKISRSRKKKLRKTKQKTTETP